MRLSLAITFSLCLALSCSVIQTYAGEQTATPKNSQDEFALARKTLRNAAEIGAGIKETIGREYVLSWIALSQAKLDDIQGAVKTVGKIKDPKRKVLSTADIASIQDKLEQNQNASKTFRQAKVFAASLTDVSDHAYTLGKIAELQAKSKTRTDGTSTFAQAIQIARSLPDEKKANTLFYIGVSQFNSGDADAARTFKETNECLSTVQEEFWKWMLAFQVAPFLVKVGDDEVALVTARTFVDTNDRYYRSLLLRDIASAQARKGSIEDALKTSAEIENEMIREETLGEISKEQLKTNLKEAIRTAESIRKNWWAKSLALVSIAQVESKAGTLPEAENHASQAVDLFQNGLSNPSSDSGWRQYLIVSALLDAGEHEKAAAVASLIKIGPLKAQSLAIVGEAYGKAGDSKRAETLLAEALKFASTGHSLAEIAVTYARIGNMPAALRTARRIPREFDRSDALQGIAGVQTQNGHARQALKWANELKSPYLKSSALLGIALGILQRSGVDVHISV